MADAVVEVSPRVLSIQSHVVHGMVGNKAGTFPMQLLGLDVDPLNVVRFSNHTGYKTFKGTRMEPEELSSVFDGLRANNIFLNYTHVLTGYVGKPALLELIADAVKEIKARTSPAPPLVYVCDPVCGDAGRLYVPAEAPVVYREKLIPMAEIATPNGFEAGVLSEIPVVDHASAKKAADWFHAQGTSYVVIKSYEIESEPGVIHLLGSTKKAKDAAPVRFRMEIPKKEYQFTGTGDCFAGIVVALASQRGQWAEDGTLELPFKDVVEHAVASLQGILELTESRPPSVSGKKELAIVQSAAIIQAPSIRIKAIEEV